MARKRTDAYANIINVGVTQSAANTLTFSEVQFGLSLFDKVGILIHRLEFDIDNQTLDTFAGSDVIEFGVVTSNQVSEILQSQNSTVYKGQLTGDEVGTAANLIAFQEPFLVDFSTLPGGGILVTPRPLYVAVDSSGLGTVTISVNVRIYFTTMELKPDEYFELLETRQFFG